jgi:site-specific DNA-methyltransferase (adenine-specific)
MKITDKLELRNCDCMDLMQQYPDKYFDLAICDPPYGIGADVAQNKGGVEYGFKKYADTNWDNCPPDANYFVELYRVSKNQIIFGGNYFTSNLKPSMGWIVWDKIQRLSFSDGELIYTSFERALRIFKQGRGANQGFNNVGRLHPTQKPVKLYEWLLANYAKEGDKILDTHLGSASIAIACDNLGFELVGSELDAEYYQKSIERIKSHLKQGVLFEKTLPNLPKPTQPTLNFEL